MDYYEVQNFMNNLGVSERKPEEPLTFDSDVSLTVNDLKSNYQYVNPIREYMIARKGVDYRDKSDEQVVDDFVKQMRYFNANTVSTAGEVRFVSKANERQKEAARKAYQIYDQLGNVFVNDGLMGAVSGVGDYVFAAAKDPTNYLGLLTGGIGRAAAGGAQVTGRTAIKAAVQRAGREALKSGATQKAAQEAARKAGQEAAARAAAQGMSTRRARGVYDTVSSKVAEEAKRAASLPTHLGSIL